MYLVNNYLMISLKKMFSLILYIYFKTSKYYDNLFVDELSCCLGCTMIHCHGFNIIMLLYLIGGYRNYNNDNLIH